MIIFEGNSLQIKSKNKKIDGFVSVFLTLKMAEFSCEHLQILKAFSIFLGGGGGDYFQQFRDFSQKWQEMAGFSIENLQIIKAFSIFLGGGISDF